MLVVDELFVLEEVDVHGPHGSAIREKCTSVIGHQEWDESGGIAAHGDANGSCQNEVVFEVGLQR